MYRAWIDRLWYTQTHLFLRNLLRPLAWVYKNMMSLRRYLYQKNFFKSTRFSIPVIVVGNITVGGTGKTQLVIALAALLKEEGYHLGIVSRGYGGSATHTPTLVSPESLPDLVGDEPILIAMRTECPLVVAKDRVEAVRFLLKNASCDIILSDDGLQHYALARAIEIAVLNGKRRLGNGLCLPAGPLREASQRLNEVDFVVCLGEANPGEYTMESMVEGFFDIMGRERYEASYFKGKKIHAVAGIAHPERFFQTLDSLGLAYIPHPFPDHHAFVKQDFAFCDAHSIIIMTEKDAVKCRAFLNEGAFFLKVSVKIEASFKERLLDRVETLCHHSTLLSYNRIGRDLCPK